jgi:hypothetical protein
MTGAGVKGTPKTLTDRAPRNRNWLARKLTVANDCRRCTEAAQSAKMAFGFHGQLFDSWAEIE